MSRPKLQFSTQKVTKILIHFERPDEPLFLFTGTTQQPIIKLWTLVLAGSFPLVGKELWQEPQPVSTLLLGLTASQQQVRFTAGHSQKMAPIGMIFVLPAAVLFGPTC